MIGGTSIRALVRHQIQEERSFAGFYSDFTPMELSDRGESTTRADTIWILCIMSTPGSQVPLAVRAQDVQRAGRVPMLDYAPSLSPQISHTKVKSRGNPNNSADVIVGGVGEKRVGLDPSSDDPAVPFATYFHDDWRENHDGNPTKKWQNIHHENGRSTLKNRNIQVTDAIDEPRAIAVSGLERRLVRVFGNLIVDRQEFMQVGAFTDNCAGRNNTLTFSWIPRTGIYASNMIDIPGMTYTIPKSQFKDMSLTCEADYKIFLLKCKRKPLRRLSKFAWPRSRWMLIMQYVAGDDDDEPSSEDERPRKKKGKTYEPSAEEVEQTEIIAKLQARWKCNDRSCKRFLCFPDKTTAKHVHSTHFHLQTWAAAAQAKVINAEGSTVDVDNPPDDKLFEFQETENEEDQQLLRTRATQKATAKDSNITINLTLPDNVLPLQPHRDRQQPAAPVPIPRRIPPQMSLALFCARFNLTDSIHTKLRDFSVTGPHTLRHLKNEHLLEAGLNHAEVANVRDAQDRWVAGEGEQ
ncbi:hypothetical protein C8R44DRAFT_724417 [Mycena epipterygia]|nr:hypothetical protein C8R44DRAFT_724417 [Mycena epipterygia]